MYESFYSLSTNPFRLTPDPRFCYSHSGYKRAHEYLAYALKLGEGFIVITGRPGTGKTTLAESFLKELETSQVAAKRIVAPNLGATGLLKSVAFAFGLPAEEMDRATLRCHIEQHFTRQLSSGRRILLILDEAQGLPHSALEELRLLADLQSGTQPLMQIFLVGQDSLRDMLQEPGMDPFQQRVIATYHLNPLALAETSAYMGYRLKQAGWKGDPEFTGEAVLSIHQYSRGVPRHINKLCNRLMLYGYGREKHTIDIDDVDEISAEMRLEELTPLVGDLTGPADLSGVSLHANALSVDALALRFDSVPVETHDMVVNAGFNGEPDPYKFPEPADDWSEQAGTEASHPAPTAHPPVFPVIMAGVNQARALLGIKSGLAGIGRLPVKPALVAAALVTAFAATAALTRFHEPQPLAGALSVVNERPGERVIADVALDNGPNETHDQGAGLPAVEQAVTDVVPLAEPLVESVSVATEPDAATSITMMEKPRDEGVTQSEVMEPVPVPESRDVTLTVLLSRARSSLETDRLSVPSGNNAYHYYSEVLARDPGNRAAQDGLERVTGRYAELVRAKIGRRDMDKARLYLERGLRIQPDNSELLVLREQMERSPVALARAAEVEDRSTIASKQQSDTFIDRLKDLFFK